MADTPEAGPAPLPPAVLSSLRGLSVGDAFGETFFLSDDPRGPIAARALRPGPWRWTDDTAMALGLVEVLRAGEGVDPDLLSRVFARNWRADRHRGYGATAQEILAALDAGLPWSVVAPAVHGGEGSMGNGAAMRVAPLGAWFADDLDRVVHEAALSAAPTHAHPDAAAGAIAVAVAAAVAARGGSTEAIWEEALRRTPAGDTLRGLRRARELPEGTTVELAAANLGTGYRMTASDTVPFVIWCATRHLDDYAEALWLTVEGLGDRDTTCAMVGGILGGRLGVEAIPVVWRRRAEGLPEGVV